jgi:hypothetical protein
MRSRNPRIDVDALERRIDEELAGAEPAAGSGERLARLAATVHARTIEAQLALAEERSSPRTAWPPGLRLPVISSSPFLQKAVLRAMALLFRDQHEADAALIRSQRELLALVQTLLERVDALEARLDDERAAARAERIAQRDAAGE